MGRIVQVGTCLVTHSMSKWPVQAIGVVTHETYVWRRNGQPATSELGFRNHITRNTMALHDDIDAPEALLTPSEVAALFRVNPKTVTRWARSGKLTALARTSTRLTSSH